MINVAISVRAMMAMATSAVVNTNLLSLSLTSAVCPHASCPFQDNNVDKNLAPVPLLNRTLEDNPIYSTPILVIAGRCCRRFTRIRS